MRRELVGDGTGYIKVGFQQMPRFGGFSTYANKAMKNACC